MKQKIRYRGRRRKEDVIYIDKKFAAVGGAGIAKDFRKKKRR